MKYVEFIFLPVESNVSNLYSGWFGKSKKVIASDIRGKSIGDHIVGQVSPVCYMQDVTLPNGSLNLVNGKEYRVVMSVEEITS